MNTLVLSLDGFHAGQTGFGGCTWTQTPGLDYLASESTVFDRFFADRLNLSEIYDILWGGERTLAEFFAQKGYKTALLSDDAEVLSLPSSDGFQIIESAVDGGSTPHIAEEMEQTRLFQTTASLASLVQTLRSAEPFFCWAHIGSQGKIWDAPQDYRARFTESGDPEPWDSPLAPNRILRPDDRGQYDPDDKLRMTQSYAGQMSLWDDCLSVLISDLQESKLWENTAVVLISTRGIGLGEHGVVGLNFPNFQTEFARQTGLIRLPQPGNALRRTQALVTYSDWRTILEELSDGNYALPQGRSRLLAAEDNLRCVQTCAWRYLFETDKTSGGALYSYPDDRWEVNDVAKICEREIQSLLEVTKESELPDIITNIHH